jgi:glutamate synthase domain-containing protein 2
MIAIVAVAVAFVIAVAIYDLTQRQHAILRTFPIIGHFRYWLEAVGPELRQYIVTDNNEERPFSRDQRRWIYASAKRENNYSGFGSDNEMEPQPSYLIIKHHTFALPPLALLAPLAEGRLTPAMRSAIALADRRKSEMPRMLAEHKRIVEALDELGRAAAAEQHPEVSRFVEELTAHAQTEEQVLYPAASSWESS